MRVMLGDTSSTSSPKRQADLEEPEELRSLKIGKCKLCLREGVSIQRSHFLPAGVYRILRDDQAKNPNPWLLTEKAAYQTSWQMKAWLLCRDCEQLLSKKGED